MNKYGARRTWSERCQRWFASKAECERGEELDLMHMAKHICYLEYQVPFTLCKKPKITITVDFKYQDPFFGEEIYEDVKGVLTRDFRTKLAWLHEKYGIRVKLIRKGEG